MNVLLILIFSFITVKGIQIKNAYDEISELYTGETTMVIGETGISYEQYVDAVNLLDNTEGITATNTFFVDKLIDRNRQSTLFIDQVYYYNYLSKMQITGDKFKTKDFMIEFTGETEIPVIINAKFANKNGLEVGDKTTIENNLPYVCELFGDDVIYSTRGDESAVKVAETSFNEQCNYDNTYEYLDNKSGYAEIPVKVIGTFDTEDRSFPGVPSDDNSSVDVIAPRFIVKDSNENKYDLQKYRSGELALAASRILLFVDYDVISDGEFNLKIQEIENKIGAKIYYEKITDWKMFEIEDNIHMYNQALVNYMFIASVVVVVWFVQLYFRLIYFQYECAVMLLLGAPRTSIISFQWKKNKKMSIVILILVAIIGFLFNMIVYTLAYYILLLVIEQKIFERYSLKVDEENINEILIGGNL